MKKIDFLKELANSYHSKIGHNGNVKDVLSIISASQEKLFLSTSIVSLSELDEWSFEKKSGDYSHFSKRFFSIKGCEFKDKKLPIISQPEIGILGFLTAMVDDRLHFLVQLKNEPGNIDGIQLSPTVQATKSNYSQVHGGNLPKHLEFFVGDHNNKVIADQCLSEQGCRYYRKRNRNIILFTKNPPMQDSTHLWLTLGQIKSLITCDNIVNSCARSVISMISISPDQQNYDERDIQNQEGISKIINLKDANNHKANLIPLNSIKNWSHINGEFSDSSSDNFKLIGCSIEAKNREVATWNQPLLKEHSKGEYGLCIGSINSKKYVLWKLRNEPGLFNYFELGPTWIKRSEILEENPLSNISENTKLVKNVELSEEGGRFYKSTFAHLIINIGEFDLENLPNNIMPFTIEATQKNMQKPNFFTIEARSLWSLFKEEDFE